MPGPETVPAAKGPGARGPRDPADAVVSGCIIGKYDRESRTADHGGAGRGFAERRRGRFRGEWEDSRDRRDIPGVGGGRPKPPPGTHPVSRRRHPDHVGADSFASPGSSAGRSAIAAVGRSSGGGGRTQARGPHVPWVASGILRPAPMRPDLDRAPDRPEIRRPQRRGRRGLGPGPGPDRARSPAGGRAFPSPPARGPGAGLRRTGDEHGRGPGHRALADGKGRAQEEAGLPNRPGSATGRVPDVVRMRFNSAVRSVIESPRRMSPP